MRVLGESLAEQPNLLLLYKERNSFARTLNQMELVMKKMTPTQQKAVAGGISESQCKAAGGTWDRGTKVCHL